ncbi:hypothetical protein OAF54_01175 [bacterium]|nr:hypothetical protein [bacterium]
MAQVLLDLHNYVKDSAGVTNANVSVGVATVNGATIDKQGYEALEFFVAVGAAGDTHCATINHKIYLEHSTDGATWSVVTNAYDVLGTFETIGSGLFKTIDADGECGVTYSFGYSGNYSGPTYRYVRIKIVGSAGNTTGTYFGVVAAQAGARTLPVA